MYSFLRRPSWILSHLLVVVLVAALVALGFWQRARYVEESAQQERLEARLAASPEDFDQVVPIDARPEDVEGSLQHRRVRITGTFDAEGEVAVLNRSRGGAPGSWVLTPLVRDDGVAVPVVRGWIPYDPLQSPPFPDSLPPDGEVTLTGSVQPSQRRGSIGSTDPAEGRLPSLSRVDVERLESQLDYELAPVWVLMDQQQPPQPGRLPQLVELELADPSQNLSYMFQWWIFAAIAAGGYPLVLRSVARLRARGGGVPPEDRPDGPSGEPADLAEDLPVAGR
jgi:surfeit locus 1 family protein